MNARRFAEKVRERDGGTSLFSDMVDRSVEHRCDTCNHLLAIGRIGEGTILETKCSKCSSMITLAVQKEIADSQVSQNVG